MQRLSAVFALALAFFLAAPEAPSVGRPLPRLDETTAALIGRLQRLDGPPQTSLAGRIVVITFFASWCAPCRREFRYLNEIRERYSAEDVAILAINWLEYWGDYADGKRMRRFLAATVPRFPVLKGSRAVAERFGGVTAIPALFVFDRRGRNVYRFLNLGDDGPILAGRDTIARVIETLR